MLYRAGTADADEPEFVDALRFVQQDESLRQWLSDQSTVREIIRVRFKQIPVPEGFKEQIISERPWKTLVVSRHEIFALAAFVGVAVLMGFALLWSRPQPPKNQLVAFEHRMVSTALRAYGMDLATNDLNQIRAYLALHHAHADYTLPAGLAKATAIGCVVSKWNGNSVTMICFKTGGPMSPGQGSDLWLFVMDQNALSNVPGSTPEISKVNEVTTASWSGEGKIYLLAVDGDENTLRNYF
ncbi:MAG TPA: hypothetical protein VH255_08685 [Verrucomicrobiae bacterium]|nr:hypothetical protein [Verrucomicrobiae bacterium]